MKGEWLAATVALVLAMALVTLFAVRVSYSEGYRQGKACANQESACRRNHGSN